MLCRALFSDLTGTDHAAARNRALVGEPKGLADERDLTPGQLALAWLLAKGDDVVPIPGTKRIDRLEENVAAVDVTLSPADLDRLETVAPRSAWAGDRGAFGAQRSTRTPPRTRLCKRARSAWLTRPAEHNRGRALEVSQAGRGGQSARERRRRTALVRRRVCGA
jgi:hypothetical protein